MSNEYASSEAAPAMPSPPIDGEEYDTAEELLKAINDFTKQHGFAVIIATSKKSPLGVKNKVYLRCSRGGKPDPKSKATGVRNAASRRIDCPFLCVADLDLDNIDKWSLTDILRSEHNHEGDCEASHPKPRRYFMDQPEIMADIRGQAASHQKPDKILTFLEKKYGVDPNNPIIGHKDIYNALQLIRDNELGNRTPIQALNVALNNSEKWFCRSKLDRKGRVEYLYFVNKSSKETLAANGEVLILDCTYKTNRYRMPLAIMTGVTDLNTSFYASLCFLKGEDLEDYEWLIQSIKELYQELDIPLPLVWLSDGEANISKAIASRISSNAVHLLCIWHIERNIVDNCRKHLRETEAWNTFFQKAKTADEAAGTPATPLGDWRKVQYAKTEDDFDLAWYNLQQKYDLIDPRICEYLEEYIISKKRKWHPVWTDKVMHFGNHASSRGEGQHAVLKASLGSSVGDLDTIVSNASTVSDRQRSEYIKTLGEAKQRLPRRLKKDILQDLITYVTPHALELILPQYQMLLNAQKTGRPRSTCTEQFRSTLGLPCSHVIERRLADTANGGRLKLEDVHYHWHFKKPERHYKEPSAEEFIDVDDEYDEQPEPVREPLLDIVNPAVVKSKGRPRGALNKPKSSTATRNRQAEAQRAFDNSTRRLPSGFEHREAEAATVDLTNSQIQVLASQPPPTGPPSRKRRAAGNADGGREKAKTGRGGAYTRGKGSAGGGGGNIRSGRRGKTSTAIEEDIAASTVASAAVATRKTSSKPSSITPSSPVATDDSSIITVIAEEPILIDSDDDFDDEGNGDESFGDEFIR